MELKPLSLPINKAFMGVTCLFCPDYRSPTGNSSTQSNSIPRFHWRRDYFAGLLIATGRYEQAIEENQKAEILSGARPEEAAASAAAKLRAFRSRSRRSGNTILR